MKNFGAVFAALLLFTGATYAQGSGSGSGTFANAYLIPTVVCQAGASSATGNTNCTNSGGGGSVLFSDIKVPSASSKDVLLMASASLNGVCTTTLLDITCTTPETIDLLLSTTSAHSFNFLVHNLSSGVYQVQLRIGVTTTATTNSVQAGAQVEVGVGAGSLVEMIIQAVTPFNNITLCGNSANSGSTPNSCGP